LQIQKRSQNDRGNDWILDFSLVMKFGATHLETQDTLKRKICGSLLNDKQITYL